MDSQDYIRGIRHACGEGICSVREGRLRGNLLSIMRFALIYIILAFVACMTLKFIQMDVKLFSMKSLMRNFL